MRNRKILRPSLAQLKKKLKVLFDLKIKSRDKKLYGGICPTCRRNPAAMICHILPQKNYPGIVFDEENVYFGCLSCNGSEYYDRLGWSNKFKHWIGPLKYFELQQKGKMLKSMDRAALLERIEKYKQELEGQ